VAAPRIQSREPIRAPRSTTSEKGSGAALAGADAGRVAGGRRGAKPASWRKAAAPPLIRTSSNRYKPRLPPIARNWPQPVAEDG
jgi:hypothetical protein